MPWAVYFRVRGEQFKPSQVNYAFTEAHDPDAIGERGPRRGKPLGYGSAVIQVPSYIPNQDRIKYLVDIALPLLPDLEQAGATEWYLDIARYYSTQCNEELTAEQLTLVAQLRCSLCYSAYQMSEEQELEMEHELETFEREEKEAA